MIKYIWTKNRTYTVESAPTKTGSVFMRRFGLILGQCGSDRKQRAREVGKEGQTHRQSWSGLCLALHSAMSGLCLALHSAMSGLCLAFQSAMSGLCLTASRLQYEVINNTVQKTSIFL